MEREGRIVFGPGLMIGAADDDPSGIATYSQAGAQIGFGLLWTMLLTYPLMAAVQLVSAHIGRVTGHGLAGMGSAAQLVVGGSAHPATFIVSPRDSGYYNWLNTNGLTDGSVTLCVEKVAKPDPATVVRTAKVVRLSDLALAQALPA